MNIPSYVSPLLDKKCPIVRSSYTKHDAQDGLLDPNTQPRRRSGFLPTTSESFPPNWFRKSPRTPTKKVVVEKTRAAFLGAGLPCIFLFQ